jgi:hypothetical protein
VAGRRESFRGTITTPCRALATDKEKAMVFHHHWQWRLGRAQLIYTRSEEGRRHLLKARARTFSNSLQPRALRLDRWH